MANFELSGAFASASASLNDVVEYGLTVGPSAAASAAVDVYLPEGLTSASAEFSDKRGLYLNGASATYAVISDSAYLDISGDIDIRCKVALDKWIPDTDQALVSKWESTTNQRSYILYVATTGRVQFSWSTNGSATAQEVASFSTLPPVSDGETIWLRVTLDKDNGAPTPVWAATFYTSADGETWTQQGSQVTGATTTSIFQGIQQLRIGASTGGTTWNTSGIINRVEIRNGIGANGFTVVNANFEEVEEGALVASGETYFSGSGLVVRQSQSGAGYFSTPDSSALSITGDLEVVWRGFSDDWSRKINQGLIGKRVTTDDQQSYWFSIYNKQISLLWTENGSTGRSASTAASAFPFADGEAGWIKATLDVNNGGQYQVNFYTAPDSETEPSSGAWTNRGTTNGTTGPTSIYNGTAALEIGGNNGGGNLLVGTHYRAIVRSGFGTGASTVFDADLTQVPEGALSFTESANGATVSRDNFTSNATTAVRSDTAYLSGEALVCGGAASRGASTPSSTALSISGDIDIACRVNVSHWANSSQSLISKYGGGSGYELQINSYGYLVLSVTIGAGDKNYISSDPNLADGKNYWVRATRVASTGAAAFYKADDSETYPTSWTEVAVGTTPASPSGNILTNSSTVLRIGQRSTSIQPVTGKIYAARISNSIDGTPVFDADFSAQTALATSFTASTGQTVTINSNGSTPSLTALPRIQDFWETTPYGSGTFTLVPVHKLRIKALASARGTQTLRAVVSSTEYDTTENHSSIDITPLPADLGSTYLNSRETPDPPCPPNILDVNALKENSFSFLQSYGNWKIRSGNGSIAKSVEQQKFLDLNSLLVTSNGGSDITLSTDSYGVGFDWNNTIPRFGGWVYSTATTTVSAILNMRSGSELLTETATKSVRANTWTWVAVETQDTISHSQTLYAEGQFVVTSPAAGTQIFFAAPVLVTTDSVTQNEFSAEIWLRLPDYFRDADAVQVDPNFPLYRFVDVLFATGSQVEFLWDWISYVPPDEGGDETNDFASNLVNPDTCCPSYLPWLADILGINLVNPVSGFTAWENLASDDPIPEPLSNWEEWQFYEAVDTDNDNANEWSELENFDTEPIDSIEFVRWQVSTAYYGLNGGTCNAMARSIMQTLSGTKSVQFVKHSAARQGYSNNPWILVVETLTTETPDVNADGQESTQILQVVKNATPAGVKVIHRSVSALTNDNTVLFETSEP